MKQETKKLVEWIKECIETVEKDKSMEAMIANDDEKAWMSILLDFRNRFGDEENGYSWVGFGNINISTNRVVSCKNQLAYLSHKIYEPLTPPWHDIESFFGEERLDRDWSNIKDIVSDIKRQSWMNTIDHLIRNKGY